MLVSDDIITSREVRAVYRTDNHILHEIDEFHQTFGFESGYEHLFDGYFKSMMWVENTGLTSNFSVYVKLKETGTDTGYRHTYILCKPCIEFKIANRNDSLQSLKNYTEFLHDTVDFVNKIKRINIMQIYLDQ